MKLLKSIGIAAVYFLALIGGFGILYLIGSWSYITLLILSGVAIFGAIIWGVYTTKYQ